MNNQNPQKDNSLLYGLLGIAGGATIVYLLYRLNKKEQELNQVYQQINRINQEKCS